MPQWRESQCGQEDEEDSQNEALDGEMKNKACFNLSSIIRPAACRRCKNKFCVGCVAKADSLAPEYKISDFIGYIKRFRFIIGKKAQLQSMKIFDNSLLNTAAPRHWTGQMISSVLKAQNSIKMNMRAMRSKTEVAKVAMNKKKRSKCDKAKKAAFDAKSRGKPRKAATTFDSTRNDCKENLLYAIDEVQEYQNGEKMMDSSSHFSQNGSEILSRSGQDSICDDEDANHFEGEEIDDEIFKDLEDVMNDAGSISFEDLDNMLDSFD